MSKPRLVIVQWRDAHFTSEEDSVEAAMKRHKAAVYWSVGVLVKSDTDGITLAMDYGLPVEEGDDITYRTRSFIPRSLIEVEINAGGLIKEPRQKKVTPEAA